MELLTRFKAILNNIKAQFTLKFAFYIYLGKCLILSPTAFDAIIMVFLITAFVVNKYFILKTPDPSIKIQKDLENLKGAVSALKLGGAINRGVDDKKTRIF